jgi:hypothetical protein
MIISASEREYLRSLAQKQREYAGLPVMAEREKLWKSHNKLTGERPMVVMEEDIFFMKFSRNPAVKIPWPLKLNGS